MKAKIFFLILLTLSARGFASDEGLRELERAAASNDPTARAAYARELSRAGRRVEAIEQVVLLYRYSCTSALEGRATPMDEGLFAKIREVLGTVDVATYAALARRYLHPQGDHPHPHLRYTLEAAHRVIRLEPEHKEAQAIIAAANAQLAEKAPPSGELEYLSPDGQTLIHTMDSPMGLNFETNESTSLAGGRLEDADQAKFSRSGRFLGFRNLHDLEIYEKSGQRYQLIRGTSNGNFIAVFAFSPDEKALLYKTYHTLRFMNLARASEGAEWGTRQMRTWIRDVTSMDWSSKGMLAFGMKNGTIKLVNYAYPTQTSEFRAGRSGSPVTEVLFHPSGDLIAYGTQSGEIHIASVPSGRDELALATDFTESNHRIAMTFSFDGKDFYAARGGTRLERYSISFGSDHAPNFSEKGSTALPWDILQVQTTQDGGLFVNLRHPRRRRFFKPE